MEGPRETKTCRWGNGSLLSLSLATSVWMAPAGCNAIMEFDDGTLASSAGTSGSGGSTGTSSTSGTPSGSSTTDPYYDAVMADGPIAYFRFADPTGPSCHNEIVESSISATYPTAGVTRAVSGIRPENAAVRFDDESAELLVFGGLDFPGDVPFTLEAWVRIDDLANTQSLYYHRNAGSPTHGTWLTKWDGDLLRTEVWNDGTNLFYTLSYTPMLQDTWLHVVVRHVQGDRDYLYVNNAEGEGGQVVPGVRGVVEPNFRWAGFVGVLDEFAVYDAALSPSRIAAHFVARSQ